MDRTQKKALGITSEDGKRGKNFKSVADAIDRNVYMTAVKDLIVRVKLGDDGAVREFLDRYYGKPAQAVDMTSNGETMTTNFINVISEDQKKKVQALEKTADDI